MSIALVVVTQEAETAATVSDAVQANGVPASRNVCRNLDDLLLALERSPASAVVVDIDPRPAQILSDLEPIINRYGEARFIVLSSVQREDLMIGAMQAGARHFLLKDRVRKDLMGVLQRLTPGTAASRNGALGSIAVVLSAGGGCGATTLAINLANELQLETESDVLLIDLDTAYGAAAGYLGMTANYGIADVLIDGDRIDAHLVRSTAAPKGDHLHLLASPATVDLDHPQPLHFEHLGRAMHKAREAFPWTVVDAPRVPMHVAGLLGAASAMTFLLLEANVEDVRMARSMHASLINRGMPAERIMPLLSRHRGRRELISRDEVQEAIGSRKIGVLSNDYKSASMSINHGKPLAASAPRSPLRTDIQGLAKALMRATRHAGAATE